MTEEVFSVFQATDILQKHWRHIEGINGNILLAEHALLDLASVKSYQEQYNNQKNKKNPVKSNITCDYKTICA